MSSLPVFAQKLPSLPDVFVSNVTTTYNGVPDDKLDDVVVNCDMLRNAKTGNPMKAIAWDEGCRSKNLHLYFEDGSGNSVQLDLDGLGNRPDIVMNPLGSTISPNQDYFLADASKSFALSNCSNSGEWLLSAWYDGQDDGTGAGGHIWMKLSPNANTMQFRATPVSTLTGKKNTLYPNPATNQIFINVSTEYTIYNQQGQRVMKGNCNKGEAVDITQLPIGNYLLQTENGDSFQFTKQ